MFKIKVNTQAEEGQTPLHDINPLAWSLELKTAAFIKKKKVSFFI